MSLTRKPVPRKIRPTPLEYLDTEKTSLDRPRDKPVYSGKMPTIEDEEREVEHDIVERERRLRLLASQPRRVPPLMPLSSPAAADDDDLDLDLAGDLDDVEQVMLVSEVSRWLTGDVDRERRARLHQSRLDHARRQYYFVDGSSNNSDKTKKGGGGDDDDKKTDAMGSILFRPAKETAGSSPWVASQVDMKSNLGGRGSSVAASKCYVKGYTPRKVINPQRSHSSLELV